MMKLKFLRLSIFLSLILLFTATAIAQKTAIYFDKNADYKAGLELFGMQKYSQAQQRFLHVLEQKTNDYSEIIVNSEYYSALCAINLFNKDAEILLTSFIANHPEDPKIDKAYYQLGKYSYRNKQYENTIKWLEKVDKFQLATEDLPEYYFNLGYSYFSINKFDKASVDFFEVKDTKFEFAAPAQYYYAHIAYEAKNYETALAEFIKLQKDENFAIVVPYYITQIYYLQANYDSVISYAPKVLETASPKRQPEIARIIGEAYYHKAQYKEAIPYFETYRKQATDVSRQDLYHLGYAYYLGLDYDNALKILQSIVNVEDSLSQNANYHIGWCNFKLGNKQEARDAFYEASNMAFDKEIEEDALFNYAKIAYELSYNPFNQAILAFQKYLDKYPNSPRKDEFYKYLVSIYMTTRNYKDALLSIDKISNKTFEIKEAYQRVAFFRAVELFNDANYVEAQDLFNKSLTYPINKDFIADANYWKAEILTRIEKPDYNAAIKQFEIYLVLPGVLGKQNYITAHYQLGYCYLAQNDYANANLWFRKYEKVATEHNSIKANDAMLRIADSYYMLNDVSSALEYYNKAIEINKLSTDYALYQKSKILGGQDKHTEKIAALQTILQKYPNSKYIDNAVFELGDTYLYTGNSDQAYKNFSELIANHPNSKYVKEAMLKIGILEYNKDQNETAIKTFKNVIEKYPSTDESKQAIDKLEDIYVKRGERNVFQELCKGWNYNISTTHMDTLAFKEADYIYSTGNCDAALVKYDAYLAEFKNGYFATNVNFYRAECLFKKDSLAEALKGYNFVINQPVNTFTEQALARASAINYKQKNFTAALKNYALLEETSEIPDEILDAQIQQMRLNWELKNYPKTIEYANKLIASEKIDKKLLVEANLMIARSALELKDPILAKKKFEYTLKNADNVLRAEAKYNLAYIAYLDSNYEGSQNIIFEQAKDLPDYDYWLAKSFILLSDDYLALNNRFQAKYTLQSIIDNHEGDELVDIAKSKLAAIVAVEKAEEEQKKKVEELEVAPFKNTENNELFNGDENK